jgi:hypothetical protein
MAAGLRKKRIYAVSITSSEAGFECKELGHYFFMYSIKNTPHSK